MTNKAKASFAAALASASAAFAQIPTPTVSSHTSYIEPTAAGWSAIPLITVGDTVTNSGSAGGTYAMAGIPDGLGAYSSGSTVTILMNHEIGYAFTAPFALNGAVRAHGSAGGFVSQWTLDKNSLQITAGQDMIQSANDVFTWNGSSFASGTTVFARPCSSDLPALSAFYNSSTSTGYNGRIYMTGEETGNEGRAFAFVATGSAAGRAYELPKLGKFSWENSVARPTAGATTAVIGLDDTTPGQVYLYLGTKSATGNAVEQAGLHNGNLYGIKVAGTALETSGSHNTTGAVGTFTLEQIDTTATGAAQQAQSSGVTGLGVTEFARPEDGQWVDDDTFVFVTTGSSGGGSAKLYSVNFTNANDLAAGGTVSLLLNSSSLTGTDGASARSFDNLTIGLDGKVYIQEDPGNADYIAKVWQVDLSDPTAAVQIFESDRDRFAIPVIAPFTRDEEHSGIIDVTNLFNGVEGDAATWYVSGMKLFLADTQAHYSNGSSLVEGGQLQLLVDTSSAIPEPASFAALAGLAGLGLAASRRRRA
jgi:MYXO-CTERM domain-containing protein